MRLLSRFRIFAAMAAGALAVSGAGLAQAASLMATYTGTVTELTDTLGAFGDPDMVLDGSAFVATFTYDPSLGEISTYKMDGGLYWGLPEMMSANLTINGQSYAFSGYEVRIEVFPTYVAHYLSGPTGWLGLRLAMANPPADYFSTMPLSAGSSGAGYGGLLANQQSYGFSLRAETLEITSLTSAVPEPGAWALMILGFGLAGAALRRRPSPQPVG